MPRILGPILVALLLLCPSLAQEAKPESELNDRFGMKFNAELYAQNTPEEAIKSIVRALDNKRVDYLLAHLTDPKFVDDRIAVYRPSIPGKDAAKTVLAFDRLVQETNQHLINDPQLLRELRFFAKEGQFEITEIQAVGKAKSVPARSVFLRKLDGRWFLENRQQ